MPETKIAEIAVWYKEQVGKTPTWVNVSPHQSPENLEAASNMLLQAKTSDEPHGERRGLIIDLVNQDLYHEMPEEEALRLLDMLDLEKANLCIREVIDWGSVPLMHQL